MNLLSRLWNRRPWGYPVPQEGEMLVGREILPIPLGKLVVEARRVRPFIPVAEGGITIEETDPTEVGIFSRWGVSSRSGGSGNRDKT